jgi:hypothetical protein
VTRSVSIMTRIPTRFRKRYFSKFRSSCSRHHFVACVFVCVCLCVYVCVRVCVRVWCECVMSHSSVLILMRVSMAFRRQWSIVCVRVCSSSSTHTLCAYVLKSELIPANLNPLTRPTQTEKMNLHPNPNPETNPNLNPTRNLVVYA